MIREILDYNAKDGKLQDQMRETKTFFMSDDEVRTLRNVITSGKTVARLKTMR